MAIECALSPQAEPASSGALGASAAGRSGGTGASAPQQGGGFASVLQGLGDAVPEAPAVPATSAPAATAPATAAVVDATTPTAPAAVPGLEKRSTTSDQTPTPDAAMQALLVQFLGLAANPVAPTMTQAQAQADLAPASRSIRPGQPLQATTLAQSAGVVKAALGSATVAAPAGAINAVPTGSAVDSTAGAAAVGHATTMRWQPQADASAAVATAKTSALPETLGVATSRVALGGETGSAHTSLAAAWNSTVAAQSAAPQMPGGAAVPVLRDVTQESLSLPATDGLTQAAAVTSLVASLSESELGVNAHKRGGARAEPVAVDVPAVSGTGVSAPSASVASAATSAVAASGQGLEQTVADQVKYWISNDVHNAQLKFDGLGAAAVQVNISMSGTQAQVVFQSDQAHTRELLGNAMTQLDQMLRGQGLTLTAAWVGSSGQQGQFGAQSQSPQSGPLPASEAAPLQSIAVAPTARRNVAPTDRALDLFV